MIIKQLFTLCAYDTNGIINNKIRTPDQVIITEERRTEFLRNSDFIFSNAAFKQDTLSIKDAYNACSENIKNVNFMFNLIKEKTKSNSELSEKIKSIIVYIDDIIYEKLDDIVIFYQYRNDLSQEFLNIHTNNFNKISQFCQYIIKIISKIFYNEDDFMMSNGDIEAYVWNIIIFDKNIDYTKFDSIKYEEYKRVIKDIYSLK